MLVFLDGMESAQSESPVVFLDVFVLLFLFHFRLQLQRITILASD